MCGMRRIVLVLVVATAVWITVFIGVWRNTGTADRPCNDTVTTPLTAGSCVLPGPSVFPALPLATVAAVAAGVGVSRMTRGRSPKATT
jgi:ABC-type anion transport system duplicated permease subunit